MARKSRKYQEEAASVPVVEQSIYQTAVYVRLSVENSGKDDDGDSIENQTSICREYIAGHPDLKLYDIYEDNGKKGTDFNRPQFQRMMEDVKAGKVRCILVKDLSRFGRDYIEAGNYLEKVFPFLGVRFISITDGYDSLTCDDAQGALMVPLKNMMNTMYAKDISRKIITSFRARQEKGDILPAFPPYGYVKSQTKAYRYEVDEKAAPYVKMIFDWRLEGISYREIARQLDDIGAVSPAQRKVELGMWKAEKYKTTGWYSHTVMSILKNPTYTGCLVYGKTLVSLYEGVKKHKTSSEDWKILPDMHEPIITKEAFERVQEMFEGTEALAHEKWAETEQMRAGMVNLFVGRIYCGDCGKPVRLLKKYHNLKGGKKIYGRYYCSNFLDHGNGNCSSHFIAIGDLNDAVLEEIKVQLACCLEQEKAIGEMKKCAKKSLLSPYAIRVRDLSGELDKIHSHKEKLYENLVEGILDRSEYQYAKKQYDERLETLEKDLEVARQEQKKVEDVLSGTSRWQCAIHKAEGLSELEKEFVELLVSKVIVYEGKRVEVVFNFNEQREDMKRILVELQEDIYG